MAVADAISNNLLFASAARTADTRTAVFDAEDTDFYICVEVTADPASASVQPEIQLFDGTANAFITVWQGTAFTAVGNFLYLLTSDSSINVSTIAGTSTDFTEAFILKIPDRWALNMNHADADSITYSVAMIRAKTS